TGRCCPTRASLLTGLYAHQAGIGHMMSDYGLDAYRGDLNSKCLTIAEALSPAGYKNYMIGKWHVTPHLTETETHNWPLQRGFDKFYGTIHGAGSFFDPNTLTRGNTFITPVNDPEYQPETFYYTDAISDNTVKYIQEHYQENTKDQPFFAYVSYTAAHWPMHALPRDIAKYEGKYDDGYTPARSARLEKLKSLGLLADHWTPAPQVGNWDEVGDKEWESACMEVYAAMVDNMDQGIGRIVDELKAQGQLENTLIMFMQDNGGCAEIFGRNVKDGGPRERPEKPSLPAMGPNELQHDMIPKKSREGYKLRRGVVMPGPAETQIGYGRNWANISNTPFREYKHYVHEGGIATPLVAHWPNGIQGANRWDDTPAHLIDLMATALDLGKAKYPNDKTPVEGVSLSPIFQGKDLERGKPLYWEHEGNRAVREGKWKLVAKGVKSKWELYDIEADRPEMNNLAEQHPERTQRMAEMYETWAKERGIVPFGSWKKAGEKKKKKAQK
ncbi:MAG: sulfatase-like hydrolase/transferase, partial [Verrucomicrobiota bacterium]